MDKFLETHSLSIVKQNKLEKPKHTNNKEIEVIINSCPAPQQKSSGPDGFTFKFYQTLKEELILILITLFLTEEEEIFLNLIYEPGITLTPKLVKGASIKKKKTEWTKMAK